MFNGQEEEAYKVTYVARPGSVFSGRDILLYSRSCSFIRSLITKIRANCTGALINDYTWVSDRTDLNVRLPICPKKSQLVVLGDTKYIPLCAKFSLLIFSFVWFLRQNPALNRSYFPQNSSCLLDLSPPWISFSVLSASFVFPLSAFSLLPSWLASAQFLSCATR